MNSFEYYNPTKIIFGKNQLSKLPQLINEFQAKKILLVYGGGSIEKTGLLNQIITQLSLFEIHLFKGVEANPEYRTLMKAVEVVREKQIDFILAVGGGSVIDGVKFISGASYFNGDPWEVLQRTTNKIFEKALPFGTILTLPATGSEANSGAVISRSEIKEKLAFGSALFFPKFSILDPTVVSTLPKRQIVNGIVDAYMHTLEQYLTFPSDNLLQEREAEGILLTLIEIAQGIIENPSDYRLASNLMYCANHALDGNLRCGVITDWSTHAIGHELTALFGIDHARSLAIIAPRLYEIKFENKKEKLEQYGKRIFQLSGENEEIAKKAIIKTEAFFNSLGISTNLNDYSEDVAFAPAVIRKRFEDRAWTKLGERQDLNPEEVELIVQKSIF
ncbi:MAG: iron-containing alcohol dehydrogenase [Flavobacteriia bacterium]|nr:iron-containing alcohol dehydrogenase [Flavobacteriia bacterium]